MTIFLLWTSNPDHWCVFLFYDLKWLTSGRRLVQNTICCSWTCRGKQRAQCTYCEKHFTDFMCKKCSKSIQVVCCGRNQVTDVSLWDYSDQLEDTDPESATMAWTDANISIMLFVLWGCNYRQWDVTCSTVSLSPLLHYINCQSCQKHTVWSN